MRIAMRRFSRFFLIALGIVLVVLIGTIIGAIWYLNAVWLPTHGKPQLEATLSQATGKGVHIDSLRYLPFRGLVANQLVVTNSPEPIITATEAELNLALGPLLLSRTATFKTRLTLDLGEPVRISAEGSYHLEQHTLTARIETERLPLTLVGRLAQLPSDIAISGGTGQLTADIKLGTDQRLQATGRLTLKEARVVWRGIELAADGTIDPTIAYGPLGGATPGTLEYTANVAIDRINASHIPTIGTLSDISGSLAVMPTAVTIQKLTGKVAQLPWSLAGTVALGKEPTIDLTLNADLDLARDAVLVPSPHNQRVTPLRPTGRAQLSAVLQGPLSQQDRLLHHARVTLSDATADLSSLMPGAAAPLTRLNGIIEYADQRVMLQSLTGQLGEAPITLDGAVALAPSPTIQRLHIETDLDLARDLRLLPAAQQQQLAAWQPRGTAHLVAELQGPLSGARPLDLVREATVSLKDFSARAAQLPAPLNALSNTAATIRYANQQLAVDASGRAGELPFTLRCSAADLTTAPRIVFNLDAGLLTTHAESTIDLQRQLIQIAALTGLWGKSRYALQGEISDFRNPRFNLYDSDVELDWNNLADHLPMLRTLVTQHQITGVTRHTAVLEGNVRDWTSWQGTVKSSAQRLTIRGVVLEGVFVDTRLQDSTIQIPTMRTAIANGTAEGSLTVDGRQSALPFRLALQTANVDLGPLLRQINPKQEKAHASGLASGTLELEGELTKQESYRGRGAIAIKGGKLFEKSLLGPLADLLQQPALSHITFHQAEGTFMIANRRVATEDLRLTSIDPATDLPQAQAHITGSVGFDQTLDLDATIQLSNQLTQSDSAFGQIASAISGVSSAIPIHIGGTIAKPEPQPLKGLATRPIQNLLQGLQGLQGILGGGDR